MQPCQEHWDQLREAVEARGLNIKTAQQLVEEGPEGDHLLAAFMSIVARSLEEVGFELLREGEGLSPCPICRLNHPEWIEEAADQQAASVAVIQ